MPESFMKIIEEICNEEGISYKLLSKDYVYILTKDGVNRFLSGHKFDTNRHGMGLVCDDKYALYDILKNLDISVCEHAICYRPNNDNDYAVGCNTYEYVHEYFKSHDNHIVIKPNNGTCGHGVYNVTEESEIDGILDTLFPGNFSISICPFYETDNEYRVIMLEHECVICYAKYLPIVIGDGKSTVRELLLKFNEPFFKDKLESSKYDRVLDSGEEYKYTWKFNLSQGSIAKNIEDIELKNRVVSLAKRVSDEINLEFGSVDIINDHGDLKVLEVNSGVMTENYINQFEEGYSVAKEMYRKAILNMFK